ncbi:cell wall anchor protein [Niastella yeongjuensis]|uniref:Cell wall anchor protein n=1 Tax=Niastella yeongjuensis TaxID=354355 RepID=A0A1V9F3N4_9BACT|nr:cell wall anchor protein [Niastella yeongjuensis]
MADCSKKGDAEPDDLADTTLLGSVKYIDTLPPSTALRHGTLHTEEDFARIRAAIAGNQEPWLSGFKMLEKNPNIANKTYSPSPVAKLIRGGNSREEPLPDNYTSAYKDVAAAYQSALYWRIKGDTVYAETAVKILNAWASICKQLSGGPDINLAAGFYGYEFAVAGELMRDYIHWKPEDFKAYQQWMVAVFYPVNHSFLKDHNGSCIYHYWANWDLGNISSIMAIGILCDNRGLYNEAVNYFQHGAGNGNIRNAINYFHKTDEGELGQLQESGRDQGHATLVMAYLGTLCEMAWNQGDDFYGFNDNAVLKASEYVAKYNVAMKPVPFHEYPYKDCDTTIVQTEIASDSRGTVRPMWSVIYNHYVKRKGMNAPYTLLGMNTTAPEGGGGDYGPNSGGYDQLGYGTLMFSR